MESFKIVTPVKTGVQKHPNPLDSGFRRNDGRMHVAALS